MRNFQIHVVDVNGGNMKSVNIHIYYTQTQHIKYYSSWQLNVFF